MHAHTHTHTHTRTTHVHTYTHTRTHIHMHAHTHSLQILQLLLWQYSALHRTRRSRWQPSLRLRPETSPEHSPSLQHGRQWGKCSVCFEISLQEHGEKLLYGSRSSHHAEGCCSARNSGARGTTCTNVIIIVTANRLEQHINLTPFAGLCLVAGGPGAGPPR